MRKLSSVLSLSAIGALCVSAGASGQPPTKQTVEFDQNVTPEVIFGTGNDNGSFTTDRRNGVEVGLRAKLRFPSENVFNSNGDGTYSFAAEDACSEGGFGFAPHPLCLATPVWSLEWSVNTDVDGTTGQVLSDFVYELGMDANPGHQTDFTKFDPITPSLIAPLPDHALGNNGAVNGGGTVAANPAEYQLLLDTLNVAQNSWNYEFFNNPGTSLESFDPAVPGNYAIYLRVMDPASGQTVAEGRIQVLTGGAERLKGQQNGAFK